MLLTNWSGRGDISLRSMSEVIAAVARHDAPLRTLRYVGSYNGDTLRPSLRSLSLSLALSLSVSRDVFGLSGIRGRGCLRIGLVLGERFRCVRGSVYPVVLRFFVRRCSLRRYTLAA